MADYIILVLCLLVILAYIFDITSKYSKVPGVVLLIGLGVLLQIMVRKTGITIPDLEPVFPVVGTLGLVLIVMDASLDIELQWHKIGLIWRSVLSSVLMFVIFVAIYSFILIRVYGFSFFDTLLNVIPLGIISSTVAIASSVSLRQDQREFIVYESSFSDIIGIIVFDFILLNQESIGWGLINFAFNGILTIIIAALVTFILAILLHKITYHVNYIIIMTCVVLVYTLAELYHLPALFLVLVFGLALSNNKLVENTVLKRFVDFPKFRQDLISFRKILIELTFLVRSFFFIMFGYYVSLAGLFNPENLITSLIIAAGIFFLRFLFFAVVLRTPSTPLVFFAPRGLITILLFLSIPGQSRIGLINEEVITLVLLMTIMVLMVGNMIYKHESSAPGRQYIVEESKKGDQVN